jgi:hypothetical protein
VNHMVGVVAAMCMRTRGVILRVVSEISHAVPKDSRNPTLPRPRVVEQCSDRGPGLCGSQSPPNAPMRFAPLCNSQCVLLLIREHVSLFCHNRRTQREGECCGEGRGGGFLYPPCDVCTRNAMRCNCFLLFSSVAGDFLISPLADVCTRPPTPRIPRHDTRTPFRSRPSL